MILGLSFHRSAMGNMGPPAETFLTLRAGELCFSTLNCNPWIDYEAALGTFKEISDHQS